MAPAVSYFSANTKSNVSRKKQQTHSGDEMEMKAEDNIDVISTENVYECQSWPAGLNDIDLHI